MHEYSKATDDRDKRRLRLKLIVNDDFRDLGKGLDFCTDVNKSTGIKGTFPQVTVAQIRKTHYI